VAFYYHRAGRCHDHHGVISGFLADLNGQCHRFRHFASCYKQAQGYILCIYIANAGLRPIHLCRNWRMEWEKPKEQLERKWIHVCFGNILWYLMSLGKTKRTKIRNHKRNPAREKSEVKHWWKPLRGECQVLRLLLRPVFPMFSILEGRRSQRGAWVWCSYSGYGWIWLDMVDG
jgi:hypothetical protein